MPVIERTVRIATDPRRVFDYVSDVQNHPAFIPPLRRVDDLSGDPRRPGTTWTWAFVMGGVELTGKASTVDVVDGERFAFTTTGIEATFTYDVAPDAGGTSLRARVSYEIPDTVLARVADRTLIHTANERSADAAVANLRAILEG